MPIYEYEPVDSTLCPRKCGRFEAFGKMSDPPLTACPECGIAVTRVISASAVHGAGAGDKKISNKNLAEKGFTKYVKAGDGYYEKAAGKGPDLIKR